MVPLKEAYLSGGSDWDMVKKQKYANDLDLDSALIAVSIDTNHTKGAQDIKSWMPENKKYHCEYIENWKAVKQKWKRCVAV